MALARRSKRVLVVSEAVAAWRCTVPGALKGDLRVQEVVEWRESTITGADVAPGYGKCGLSGDCVKFRFCPIGLVASVSGINTIKGNHKSLLPTKY